MGARFEEPEICKSDALKQGGARLLVLQQASLLLHGGPHNRQAEVDSHPGGEQGLGEGDALEVDKAKVGLVVLQAGHDEGVPQGIELGTAVVQHSRQPGMQSLKDQIGI